VLKDVFRIDDGHDASRRNAFFISSSVKKTSAPTGAGLARPVVSMRMPSSWSLRLKQVAEDADEIAAHGAADAGVVHLEEFLVARDHELMIDADFADSFSITAVFCRGFGEDAVEERGLAAPRKPVRTVTGSSDFPILDF